ncbi:MAG TPA: FecR domain-containing protein [Mucilaginibacter sp.]|jgi:ferric-dicitrate binding protein FerR (iron transport regulator)
MENEQIIGLIDKYLAGNCTPEEARSVEQWYESYLQTGVDFYQGDKEAINAAADRSLSAIRARLGLKEDSDDSKKLKKLRPIYKWLAAACILTALAIGAITYQVKKERATFTIVGASNGEVKHIKLPDGTNVWLNAGSTLKYSSAYNTNDRQVYLTGEAYFGVRDDRDKPFIIYSGQLKTQVLGTAFSVSAYPEAQVNTITVVQGKVQVSKDDSVLGCLLPNQELEYTVRSGVSSFINTNAEKMASWKSGKLAFVQMPMQDIAIHLQKWYGVTFIFKNEQLKDRRFTASFDNHIHLNDLLAVMYEVCHTEYRVDEHAGTVTFL